MEFPSPAVAPSNREITIHIRSSGAKDLGKNLAEWLRVLRTIQTNQKETDFIISFEKCSFLSPFIILPLILTVKSLTSEGYNIRFDFSEGKIDSNLLTYLKFIHFPNGMHPENLEISQYEAFLNKYTSKTYIPIVSLPETKSKEAAEIRDKFRNAIHSLIDKQCQLKGQIKSAVFYLIDEALNNISEHSQSERGFVFAQYFTELKCLLVCIGDTGLSIFGSYKRINLKEVSSPTSAIEYAIEGISTKPDKGRGFGIRTSKKMLVEGLGGGYLLYSGMAFNIHDSEKNHIVESHTNFTGTCLFLSIPLNPTEDFKIVDYLDT